MREFYHLLKKYEITPEKVKNIPIYKLIINKNNKSNIINNFSF